MTSTFPGTFLEIDADGVRPGTGDPEDCEILACPRADGRPAIADALLGTCARCEHGIFFSPRSPTRPRKVCLPCAHVLVSEEIEREISAS